MELEKEIARRQEAERKLEEVNQGLQAFAYAASHDLQEPLRKIKTFTSILYSENEQHFDPRSKANAQKIMAATDRMKALISNVLTLSSISEDIPLEAVDTNAAVQKALDDLELAIVEKKAAVYLDSLPVVQGNEAYLTQLFYNLLSNALKFNDKPPVVTITGTQSEGKAVITFSDNGIGMHKEDYQKVFGAFQRLHARAQYEGTGIGLAIVKKILEVHKGEITVDSQLGKGTTFTLILNTA